MASDNQASYSKIGFTLILGVLLIIGTVIYLGGMRNANDEFYAETYFENGVSGLDAGSSVNFRGVKVGSVKEISFIGVRYPGCTEADAQTVWVRLALNRKLAGITADENSDVVVRDLVQRGLHATVSASGITGLSRIELDMKPGLQDKAISWKPRNLCIPPAPSILESAANTADRILAQIDRIDLVDGWTNVVNALTSAHSVLGGVDDLLQTQGGKVSQILDDLQTTASSLRDFADQIKSNPTQLLRSFDVEPLPETRRQ